VSPATIGIALQAADCDSRPIVSCRDDLGGSFTDDPTAQALFDEEVTHAVALCVGDNMSMIDVLFEVSAANGCPRTLAVPAGVAPAVVTCLKARFERARWDCAVPLACGSYNTGHGD
jgi:hypothetical protein